MLQIKKKGQLVGCKYNLRVLFRRKNLTQDYRVKKVVGQTIYLRSPKHFNIGKQKILNLNFKALNLVSSERAPFYLSALFNSADTLYNILRRRIKTNPVLLVSSVKCSVRTKFTIMWLVILF